MWVVGILRPFSETSDETIGRELRNIWQEGDPGEGDSGAVAWVECGTAELGDRLTALWESGCPMSIVGVGATEDGAAEDHLEHLDLAVIEVDVMRFDATELGSLLARLDQQAVPFFFLMSGVPDGKDVLPEIPLTLAQFGTVCPFPLPTSNRDAGLRQLRDYVLQRLDKHYGERDIAAEPKPTAAERRAFPRWQLDCPAIAKIAGRDHPCRVVDISGGGIALDLAIPCEIGGEIVVNLEDVRPLRGKIVHIGKRHVGVQFTMDAAEHSEALALIAQVVAGRAQAAE
jgi:hypothetical protein